MHRSKTEIFKAKKKFTPYPTRPAEYPPISGKTGRLAGLARGICGRDSRTNDEIRTRSTKIQTHNVLRKKERPGQCGLVYALKIRSKWYTIFYNAPLPIPVYNKQATYGAFFSPDSKKKEKQSGCTHRRERVRSRLDTDISMASRTCWRGKRNLKTTPDEK